MRQSRFLLTAALLLGAASACPADFISTLGQPFNVTSGNVFATTDRVATDFLTDNTARTITTLRVKLANNDDVQHNLRFSIFTNSGTNVPGVQVGTSFTDITMNAGDVGFQDRTATNAGISLAANTTYWLVMQQLEAGSTDVVTWDGNSGQGTDAGSVYSTVAGTQLQFQ
jgi:hypothetical protein